MARFTSKTLGKDTALLASSSDGEAVRGESTSRPALVGLSQKDAGVIGFHGDPKLNETTVANDGGRAGVFGASEDGAGVLGYSRDSGSFGVYAFGGLRAIALGRPFAAEFEGDLRVNGDIQLVGADCAEQFDVARGVIEPGTVVVIDADGALRESDVPYDSRVAGVVAGAGTYRPAIVLDQQESSAPRVAVSLVGKVFCKVDGTHAPIGVGDLLTTSATPGRAMKATDPARAFGAIIGKALRPCSDGHGLIPILIALG
jgi:hypothetical protein